MFINHIHNENTCKLQNFEKLRLKAYTALYSQTETETNDTGVYQTVLTIKMYQYIEFISIANNALIISS